MAERFVALLRGVNVGGNNRIAMKSLVALFEDSKCGDVESYIQSGNVVFTVADAKAAARAGTAICKAIESQFSFRTQIVVRSLAEMERIVAENPYVKAGLPVDKLHVVFLADRPSEEQAAGLDPARWMPDEFTWVGGEIYLYLPSGAGQTKLSNAYFDSKFKTVSTGRNWRTTQKLLEMMRNA